LEIISLWERGRIGEFWFWFWFWFYSAGNGKYYLLWSCLEKL